MLLLTVHLVSLYVLHWSVVIPQATTSSGQSRSLDSLLTRSTSMFMVNSGESSSFANEDELSSSAAHKTSHDRPTVAFITYELYPVSRRGGGAGVVINGLVQELLENGHDVVMLADFGRPFLVEWQQHIHSRTRSTPQTGSLHVFQVDSVMGLDSITFSKSIFMRKSRMFALALARVNRIVPFDIVECFDYAGVAYELLRPKEPDFKDEDYLPDRVAVSIRFHGTLQLIERAEGNEAPLYPPSDRSIMYLQEQYSLMAADLLFCQTKAMKGRLSQHYKVKPEHLQLAPVPMNSILRYVDDAIKQIPDNVEYSANQKPRKFLVYGRMQLVKGLETVIKAAVLFLDEHADDEEKFEFLLVGPDIWLTEGNRWTSTYLSSFIPTKYQSQIVLNNMPIDRDELAKLSKQVYAAIFASQFESLNLAVHEIARMNVPLLLSDIPAFVEFFQDSKIAHIFQVSNEQSLRDALNWITFSEEGAGMVKDARSGLYRLGYNDSTSVYRNYIVPEPRRRWSTQALQLAAHINEQEDILNKNVSPFKIV